MSIIRKYLLDKVNRIAEALELGWTIRGNMKACLGAVKTYKWTIFRENLLHQELSGISCLHGYANVGIVYQGPVLHEDDFTIESILMLREQYPDIKIVLSTWIGELTVLEKKTLMRAQCHIIENESLPAEDKGEGEKVGHMNNQIYSSYVGLSYLQALDVQYAMKIRADIRIYKYDFIPYLLNMIKLFPVGTSKLKNRLVNIAFSNSLFGVPFHMSDFIWFGQMDDILAMYDVPQRTDDEMTYIRSRTENVSFMKGFHEYMGMAISQGHYTQTALAVDFEFLSKYVEEVYLAVHLYRKIHSEDNFDTKSKDFWETAYRNFLVDNIIIVDDDMLICYWNKGTYSQVKTDYAGLLAKRMSHSSWLGLYMQSGGGRNEI